LNYDSSTKTLSGTPNSNNENISLLLRVSNGEEDLLIEFEVQVNLGPILEKPLID
jgi:hypothetical protein